MADTLSIRLEAEDRQTLTDAARQQGTGLSAFVGALAEAEARRLRREAIRSDGDRVVAYLEEHPESKAELEAYGTPIGELP